MRPSASPRLAAKRSAACRSTSRGSTRQKRPISGSRGGAGGGVHSSTANPIGCPSLFRLYVIGKRLLQRESCAALRGGGILGIGEARPHPRPRPLEVLPIGRPHRGAERGK